MRISRWPIFTIVVLSGTLAANAQDYTVCQTLIDKGLRQYSIRTDSREYLNHVSDQYCDQRGNTTVTNASASLDVIVKEIPINLTGDYKNTQQAFSNFCRNYKTETYAASSMHAYDETIVSRAYDSFDSCVKLISQGVSVVHDVVSLSALNFSIVPGAQKPIKVMGVVTSNNITCSGNIAGKNGATYTKLVPATVFEVKDQTFGFACRRDGIVDLNNTTTYEEGTVQVLTNWGNYSVFVPRDRTLAQPVARAIVGQFDALSKAIGGLNTRISGIRLKETDAAAGPDFACSQENVASTALTFMVGLKDGTGCGVNNKNYYKTISIEIPADPGESLSTANPMVRSADAEVADAIDHAVGSFIASKGNLKLQLVEDKKESSAEFSCGKEDYVSADSFKFLVGRYDSTTKPTIGNPLGRCSTQFNINYYKKLSISTEK